MRSIINLASRSMPKSCFAPTKCPRTMCSRCGRRRQTLCSRHRRMTWRSSDGNMPRSSNWCQLSHRHVACHSLESQLMHACSGVIHSLSRLRTCCFSATTLLTWLSSHSPSHRAFLMMTINLIRLLFLVACVHQMSNSHNTLTCQSNTYMYIATEGCLSAGWRQRTQQAARSPERPISKSHGIPL